MELNYDDPDATNHSNMRLLNDESNEHQNAHEEEKCYENNLSSVASGNKSPPAPLEEQMNITDNCGDTDYTAEDIAVAEDGQEYSISGVAKDVNVENKSIGAEEVIAGEKSSAESEMVHHEEHGRRSSRTPKPRVVYFAELPASHAGHAAGHNSHTAGRSSNNNSSGTSSNTSSNSHDESHSNEDGEDDIEMSDSQSGLGAALPALKKFFTTRLEQVVVFLGGTLESLSGWKTQVVRRTGGLTQGLVDVYYHSTKNRKFRSRVEAAISLGLLPYVRQLRNMSREQLFISAMETREKQLVAQELYRRNGRCETVRYEGGAIIIDNGEPVVPGDASWPKNPSSVFRTPSAHEEEPWSGSQSGVVESRPNSEDVDQIKNSIDEDSFFTFGNTTVLSWGKISQETAFHSAGHIFPIGFKCVRQEHDALLDKIVDIKCEIDAMHDETKHAHTQHKTFVPLFRVTVAWEIQGKQVVRVYEARSPQQAWQAAVLEQIGIEPNTPIENDGNSQISATEKSETDVGDEMDTGEKEEEEEKEREREREREDEKQREREMPFEEEDEEERQLRTEIRDQRRSFFRALRVEQSLGLQAAVKPRLSLEAVDGFADDNVMRLIEGMEGAIDCKGYQFLDARDRDGGRKSLLRGLAKVHFKGRLLDKLLRKQNLSDTASRKLNMDQMKSEQLLQDKKQRFEENEARRKIRSEEKDLRTKQLAVEASRKNEIRIKIRDVEKIVKLSRETLSKSIRKRKDDARLRVEIMCDKEEASKILRSAPNNGNQGISVKNGTSHRNEEESGIKRPESLPLPPSGAVRLEGELFGQVLEFWTFLSTFSQPLKVLSIPSIAQLTGALRACDPNFKKLKLNSKGATRSFETVSAREDPNHPVPTPALTPEEAGVLLDSLGVLIASTLMKDFHRVVGLDQTEQSMGECIVPLNALTWREIVRTVLLSWVCREVSMGEADVSATIRGKGFFTTPETADRKALKLSRKRIMFSYTVRDENQEAVYGFNSGLVIRVPAPSPHTSSDADWRALIYTLKGVSGRDSWLVREVIEVAIALCDRGSNAQTAGKIKRSLKKCLLPPLFSPLDATPAKHKALSLLKVPSTDRFGRHFPLPPSLLYTANLGSHSNSPVTVKEEKKEEKKTEKDRVKEEKEDSSDKYKDEEEDDIYNNNDYADHDNTNAIEHDASSVGAEPALPHSLPHGDDHLDDQRLALYCSDTTHAQAHALNRTGSRTLSSGLPLSEQIPLGAFSTWARQHVMFVRTADVETEKVRLDGDGEYVDGEELHDEKGEEGEEGKEDEEDDEDDVEGEGEEEKKERKRTKSEKLERRRRRDKDNGRFKPKERSPVDLDADVSDADKLSAAMLRCYLVVKDLMNHAHAIPFCFPVDPAVYPGYYKTISQPLSLSDIRRNVLDGKYELSITRFYCDVILVLENAMAYNHENQAVNASAQKLAIVFERMMLEVVLSWEAPLPFADSCHICRSLEAASEAKWVQCERCEALYHLKCLDPPVTVHPRVEWYCPSCVEQKGVAFVHPNKTSEVVHPDSDRGGKEQRGTVVGIEQIKGTLRFIVEFGSGKEMWSGRKVRKYCRAPVRDEGSSADFVDDETYPPTLPSGYDYDDMDAVCGLAKGNTGWGATHCFLPPAVSDVHSIPARLRGQVDPFFNLYRGAVVALSAQSDPTDLGASEWLAVLRALAHKVITTAAATSSSTSFLGCVATLDEEGEACQETLMHHILHGTASVETLIRPMKCAVGDCVVVGEIPTPEINSPSLGSTIGLGDCATNGFPVPTATAPQAASSNSVLPSAPSSSAAPTQTPAQTPTQTQTQTQIPQGIQGPNMLKMDPPKMILGKKRKGKIDKNTPAKKQKKISGSNAPTEAEDEEEEFDEDHGSSSFSMKQDKAEDSDEEASEVGIGTKEKISEFAQQSDALGGTYGATPGLSGVIEGVPGFQSAVALSANDIRLINWDHRRISRKKGREDALLTQNLVCDVMGEIDMDGPRDEEGRILDPEFYPAIFSAMMRGCICRPGENLDADEWAAAWGYKMETFGQNKPASTTIKKQNTGLKKREFGEIKEEAMSFSKQMDKEGDADALSSTSPCAAGDKSQLEVEVEDEELDVCGYCGFEEKFLGNQFVKGQTWQEWEDERDPSKLLSSTSLTAGKRGGRLKDDGKIWLPSSEEEANAERTAREELRVEILSNSCTTLEGETAEKRSANAASQGTLTVTGTGSGTGRVMKEHRMGSVTVHECCADYMSKCRHIALGRAKRVEEQRIVALLASIGSAKNIPLGTDSAHNIYWCFSGTNALYICSSQVTHSNSQSSAECSGTYSGELSSAFMQPLIAPEEHSTKFLLAGSKYISPSFSASFLRGADPYAALTRDVKNSFCGPEEDKPSSFWWVYERQEDIGMIINRLDTRDSDERLLKRILCLLFPTALQSQAKAEEIASSSSSSQVEEEEGYEEEEEEEEIESDQKEGGEREDMMEVLDSSSLPMETEREVKRESERAEEDDDDDEDKEEDEEEDEAEAVKDAVESSSDIDARHSVDDNGGNVEKDNRHHRVSRTKTPQSLSHPAHMHHPTQSVIAARNNAAVSASAFKVDQKVLVCTEQNVLWDARVVELRAGTRHDNADTVYYRMRFDKWGTAYDGWYEESCLAFSSSNVLRNKTLRLENRKEIIEKKVFEVPELIQTLNAFQFYEKPDRACLELGPSNSMPTPVTYSDCGSPLGMIRAAMLMVWSALPQGCLDEQDDRWGEDFSSPWRECVLSSPDCPSLMQAQLMLEYGVKTGWYSACGIKLLSTLPSRSHSLRTPTLGLLALRLWTLDRAIKYDKTLLPGDKSSGNGSMNRGRPKGAPNNPTGSRKKKKTY